MVRRACPGEIARQISEYEYPHGDHRAAVPQTPGSRAPADDLRVGLCLRLPISAAGRRRSRGGGR